MGGLERGIGSLHTVLRLLLGGSDVGHSLGILLVAEGSLGIQSSDHLLGSRLEGKIGVVTILSHLLADTTELGSGLGHHDLELVVGLADGLVLGLELGSQFATASGGLGTGIGN